MSVPPVVKVQARYAHKPAHMCNVPAGRWRKRCTQGSNCERNIFRCVLRDDASRETCISAKPHSNSTALPGRLGSCNVPAGRWRKGAGNVQKANGTYDAWLFAMVQPMKTARALFQTNIPPPCMQKDCNVPAGRWKKSAGKVQKASAHVSRVISVDFTTVEVCDTGPGRPRRVIGDGDAPALPKRNASM